MNIIVQHILLGLSAHGEWDGHGMYNISQITNVCHFFAKNWWGPL